MPYTHEITILEERLPGIWLCQVVITDDAGISSTSIFDLASPDDADDCVARAIQQREAGDTMLWELAAEGGE